MVTRDRLRTRGGSIPEDQLGAALLGNILHVERPVPMPGLRGRLRLGSWWSLVVNEWPVPPATAATAWRELVDRTALLDASTWHGIALELDDTRHGPSDDVDRADLLDVLGRTSGVAAVHLATGQRSRAAGWLWPPDLALFDDPPSRELRSELAALPAELASPIAAARTTAPIELLVLGDALPAALARVRDHPRLPRVHTVLVLGGLAGAADPAAMAELLRGHGRADAVCAVHVPERDRRGFVEAVLERLSQDHDVDVALGVAARDRGLPPPFIIAAGDAFVGSHRTARHGRPAPSKRSAATAGDIGEPLGGPAGGADSARGLEAIEKGIVVPDATRGMEDAIDQPVRAMPPAHEPARDRYLQAELFHGEPPVKVDTAPLAVGTYRLDVWIGPPQRGAMHAPARVPEEELPPSAEGHELAVVLTSPALGEPQVATLVLPPDGASRPVRFAFAIPEGIARLEARIALLHENRVLQTVVLAADVVAGAPAALELALEGVVRRNLDAIGGRRPFDVALIANRMSEKRTVSVIASGRVSLVPAGTSIDALVKEVSALLGAATNNPKRYGKPDSEGTTELLADLARKGYLLREALLDMPQVRSELETAKRIQIVIALPDETTLPLEICYDGVAPGVGAKMCPEWQAALDAGACQAACPADRSTVVCPVAFWGTHRVIERHAYAKVDAARLGGNAYGLQQEPAAGRARLSIVGGSVCAAADIARSVDSAAVDQAFAAAGAVAQPGREAKTWADWKATIRGNPSILVLLAHSDMARTNRALVIGADETEIISDIDAALVGQGGGSGPIVLLLGCSTAIAEVAFQSFVARFRVAGAAIVIGTLCEILGQHAAPIAAQLLAELRRAATAAEPTPIGDLIPALRRRLLARGYPIVLAVAPYGDADWQI